MKRTSALLVSHSFWLLAACSGDDDADPTPQASRPDRSSRHDNRPAVDDVRRPSLLRRPHSHRRPRHPTTTDAPTTSPTTVPPTNRLGVRRPDAGPASPRPVRGARRQPDPRGVCRGLPVRRATRRATRRSRQQGMARGRRRPVHGRRAPSSRISTATASTPHWSSRSSSSCSAQPTGARSSTRRVPWSRGSTRRPTRVSTPRTGPPRPERPTRGPLADHLAGTHPRGAWMRKWSALARRGGDSCRSRCPRRRAGR